MRLNTSCKLKPDICASLFSFKFYLFIYLLFFIIIYLLFIFIYLCVNFSSISLVIACLYLIRLKNSMYVEIYLLKEKMRIYLLTEVRPI